MPKNMSNDQFLVDVLGSNPKLLKKKQSKIKFQNKIFNSVTYTPPNRIDFKDIKLEVVFKDCSKKFVNLPALKFSNKKSEFGADSKTMLCLKKIIDEPSIIQRNSSRITIKNNDQGKRIKDILYNFLEQAFVDFHESYFRKSSILDNFNILSPHEGRFRVICVYTIKSSSHKKERTKHYLEVVLLDPYHLFIPSKLKIKDEITGKDILLDSVQAMHRTYEQVKDYNREFSLENIN